MKTYQQTRKKTIVLDTSTGEGFSKSSPKWARMKKEIVAGVARIVPFAKTWAQRRRMKYLEIRQAEINEALLDFILWENREKLDELKARFDAIKEEHPK